MSAAKRRDVIARILRTGEVDSQETLGAALRRHGFEVTQATLSRDLAAIGARRVTVAGGGSKYELDTAQAPPSRPSTVNALVRDVVSNGALVVVLTTTAAAAPVAAAIDAAQLEDMLGTIAGDDTIFIAPKEAKHANRLAKHLRTLFGLED